VGAALAKPIRKIRELFTGVPERLRWTAYPLRGRCPTWVAGEGRPVSLDLSLSVPASAQPGEYAVSLAARDRSVFVPIRFRDFFVDEDSFQGPTVGTVDVR
jgi:hypothetical protein